MTSGALTSEDVVERLGFHGIAASWVETLEGAGPPTDPVALPEPDEAAELLASIGVGAADADDVGATLPSPEGTPEWWWILERSVQCVVKAMGDADSPHFSWPDWSAVRPNNSLQRRCFMAHLYLATMPHTAAWQAARGIEERVTWASFADLGRHMRIHRETFGTTGIDDAWWLTMSLRSEVFDIGRLQYGYFRLGSGDQSVPWYSAPEALESGSGFGPGDECVAVHIPESGPLTPEACDESIAEASGFFAAHFPTPRQDRRVATCWSWLLDDQLADWLPPESNIVKFQRRFELVPGHFPGNGSIFKFVFRRPYPHEGSSEPWLDSFTPVTTLERAIVDHVRAGGEWRMRSGWFDFDKTG